MRGIQLHMAQLALGLLVSGCGSRSGLASGSAPSQDALAVEVAEASVAQPRALSQSECLDNWEVLLDETGVSGGRISVEDTLLIFPWALWAFDQFEMRGYDLATPERGTFVVAPGTFSRNAWLSGADLLYVDGSQLYAVPLEGGATRVLLQPSAPSGVSTAVAVTSGERAFYWIQPEGLVTANNRGWSVYRQPHASGVARRLATIDTPNFRPAELVWTEAGLLVFGNNALDNNALGNLASGVNATLLVPLDGGRQRWLAELENGGSAGADEAGVYAERLRSRGGINGQVSSFELLRAPLDGGGVETLWSGPEGRRLQTLKRSGRGWVAAGWDTFEDGRHAALFWLEESGRASYLGCGPVDSTLRSELVVREDPNGSFVYVSAGTTSGPGVGVQTRWLVRVGIPQY